jgi:hypothetical protein
MVNLNEIFKQLSETLNGVNGSMLSDETKEKLKALSTITIVPEFNDSLKELVETLKKEGGLLPKINADVKLDELDSIKKCLEDAFKPLKDLNDK